MDKTGKNKKNQSEESNPDQSHLDKKYFIDEYVYNCPFCNRGHVQYRCVAQFKFNWSKRKNCYVYFVKCLSCEKISMHLSKKNIVGRIYRPNTRTTYYFFKERLDIDSNMFSSVPTSFFTVDNRIPEVTRELLTEAEGCLKMNYLTGASACARKAIYEFTREQCTEGKDYEEKIKSLKKRYPSSDPELFDILAHIQGMTSDKIHEQSWPKWDSARLKLMLETLKTVLYDIYVLPKEKKARSLRIQKLKEEMELDKKQETSERETEEAES